MKKPLNLILWILCSITWSTVALLSYNDRPWYATLAIMSAAIFWTVTVRKFTRLSLIAALAFISTAQAAEYPEQPQPILPYAIGVVVIVVGGVVTYKFVRFCQRKFPKDQPPNTNAPPDQVFLPGGETAAAAWTYASLGSCYWPPPLDGFLSSPGPGVFQIEAQLLDPDGAHPRLQSQTSRWLGPEATEDAPEFFAEIAALGLTMSPNGNGQSWSVNNLPVIQEQCPIVLLGDEAHTVEVHATNCTYSRVVVIERSYDLQEWAPVVRTVIQAGMKLRFQDATESGSAFYRLKLQNL